MRALCIISCVLLFIQSEANANPIDSTQAKIVAKNFYNSNRGRARQAINLSLAFIERATDGQPACYVLNVNQTDGFVIVSGDDAALPILGYSTFGSFNREASSPAFLYWLDHYADQIGLLKQKNIQATKELRQKWNSYRTNNLTVQGSRVVTPLLKTTWDQSAPYNDSCPYDVTNHVRTLTGCVATAMAQIMKYWNYPVHGIGTSTYIDLTNAYGVQTADFGNATYDWSKMPNTITSSNSEIAKLMYHCGVSVAMNYGIGGRKNKGSGAWVLASEGPNSAELAYSYNFGYNPATIKGIRKDDYADETLWINDLKNELDNGRPIQYVGANSESAHTWVCDGYDDGNGLFSMNWGWGGRDNGWYLLSDLVTRPNQYGYYGDHQAALIGIQPKLPDLFVESPQPFSASIVAGSPVTASCIMKNQGWVTAGSSYTAIWLSKDRSFSALEDINLNADIAVPSLSAGTSTGTLSKQIIIPSGTAPGAWYIMFGADALSQVFEGTGESNNQIFIPITVTNSTCTSPVITSSPSNKLIIAPAGTSFTVSASGSNNIYQWQVNTGTTWSNLTNSTTYSGINGTSLIISSTTSSMNGYQYRCYITSSCTTTTATSNAATLTVSSSSSTGCNNDFSCGPPSPLALPIYSSCVATSCSTVGATPPTQDIPFTSCAGRLYQSGRYDDDVWFTITPTSTNPVTITVTPTSNLTNFDPVVGLYSGNCLTPTQVGCADVNGEGGSEQLVFTPVAGTTYLIRVFSYDIGSTYSGNFNICATAAGQTTSNPDLIISNADLSVNSICDGNSLDISYDVVNIGGASASSSTVKFFLSSNSSYSSSDILIGSTSVTGISANSSISKSRTLIIPPGTISGTWYVLTMADANSDVSEGTSGESNNVTASPIQVTNCTGSADLKITYLSSSPSTVTPGTRISVNYEAKNIGSGYAANNKIGIYLSSDNNFDPSTDEFINDWARGSVDGGETVTGSLSFSIPDCASCGNFYVFLVINYDRAVNESDYANNTSSFPATITGCTTCTYTVPSTGITFQSSGGSGNFTVTTTKCCPWTATTNDIWIKIINSSGKGNGTVNYTVDPCVGGSSRTGTITVGNQTHTITQNCTTNCNFSQTFVWAKQAGSPTLSDAAADLAIDALGNLYMTGDIQGSATFGNGIVLTTPSTAPDVFVSKHGPDGTIQWANRYGNTGQDVGRGIAVDNANNVYVVGSFLNSVTLGSTTLTSSTPTDDAAFILKLNSAGAVQWAKAIYPSLPSNVSGISIDNVGNIYVLGDLNYGDQVYIAKYNSSGTQVWVKTYANSINFKKAEAIATDGNGNILICGRYLQSITLGAFTLTSATLTDGDGFISKLDANGNVLWAKQLISPGKGQDGLFSMTVSSTNEIYAVGHVDSTAIIGNITIPRPPGDKFIMIKFDQNGNALWAKVSNAGGYPQKIIIGLDGDLYFGGTYNVTMQIDQNSLTSSGTSDAFFGRMDTNGKIKWLKSIGGSQNEVVNGIATNANNDIYAAGAFRGTVAFDNNTLTSTGSDDIFLAKFKQCDPPVATIGYSGLLNFCQGQSLTFSTADCSSYKYQWQLNGNDIVGSNSSTYTATETGTFRVKIMTFPGCEATSPTASVTVTSSVAPTVDILPFSSKTICSGDVVSFSANATNGGAAPKYEWYLNGSLVGTNSATYTTQALTSNSLVYCKMTSNASCASPNVVSSTTTSIIVNASMTPNVSVALTSGSNPSCSGQSLTFTASPTNGGNNPSYQWKVGTSNVGTNSSTFTTNNLTNGSSVSCVLTSNALCANPADATSAPIVITMNPTVIPAVSIAANPSGAICSGQSVSFTATLTNGGNSPSYQWKVGTTNVGTNSANYITSSLTNGQSVTCQMTSNASCASPSSVTSSPIVMTVSPTIVPTVTITQTSCTGNSVSFSANISNGGTTPGYQWSFNGTGSSNNSSGSTFTLDNTSNGTKVKCILTSSDPCANPNKVTSDSLTINCIVTALPTVDGLQEFKIIPNPSQGIFNVRIKLTTMKDVSFKLVSLSGQTVYQSEVYHILGTQTKVMNQTGIAAGTYLLETKIGKETIIEKIVIVR